MATLEMTLSHVTSFFKCHLLKLYYYNINFLKINPDKTKFIITCKPCHRQSTKDIFRVTIRICVFRSESVCPSMLLRATQLVALLTLSPSLLLSPVCHLLAIAFKNHQLGPSSQSSISRNNQLLFFEITTRC